MLTIKNLDLVTSGFLARRFTNIWWSSETIILHADSITSLNLKSDGIIFFLSFKHLDQVSCLLVGWITNIWWPLETINLSAGLASQREMVKHFFSKPLIFTWLSYKLNDSKPSPVLLGNMEHVVS